MFDDLLARIGRELEDNDIKYMVIGGQAVLVYGEPRLTKDIDITLGCNTDKLDQIVNIVEDIGLQVLVEDIVNFVSETLVLPVADKKTGVRVDFIFSYSNYEKEALERVNKVKMGGENVRFASLEDTIIHKIIANRPKDIEDARNLILKNPDFDRQYIEKWLNEFDAISGGNSISTYNKILNEIE